MLVLVVVLVLGRGSAIECAACLDASVAKGFVVLQRIEPGKAVLVAPRLCLPNCWSVLILNTSGRTDPVVPIEHEHDAAVATLWRALAMCEEHQGLAATEAVPP